MYKTLIALCFVAATGSAAAQTTTSATATMNKQQLVDRVLQLWHPEAFGEAMLQEPVADAVQQARALLQGRSSGEKRDAAMQDITTDAKKFLEDAAPLVRTSSQKLAPTTIGPLLAARFTEDELRQIIAILESPVKSKFEGMLPEMHKALGEKVASDTRTVIDPKLQDLKQRIGMRLRTAITQ